MAREKSMHIFSHKRDVREDSVWTGSSREVKKRDQLLHVRAEKEMYKRRIMQRCRSKGIAHPCKDQ